MVTGSVMVGRTDVGAMVRTPAPGTLKAIRSAPGLALASRIACLNDPAPPSAVLVTVKVAVAGTARSSSRSRRGGGALRQARFPRRGAAGWLEGRDSREKFQEGGNMRCVLHARGGLRRGAEDGLSARAPFTGDV